MEVSEATRQRAEATSVDFGRALGALLRTYLDGAQEAVHELPGGPRGFQVMSLASASTCSSQAQMAESLGLDRTVMTYLVDDLERAGLVERRPDPADRRARQVLLTPQGRESYEAAAHRIESVERAVLGGLSETDAETFRALLLRIVTTGPVDATAEPCDQAPPSC